MKSFIIVLLLIGSSLYADAKLYLGLGYATLNDKFENMDSSKTHNSARIKIGYGLRDSYAIELSLEGIKNESAILSQEDEDRYGANLEIVKAFDLDTFLNPYFKAGFGAGSMKIKADEQNSLSYGSFNFGLGTFIPINEHFDFELAYEYKYTTYEETNSDEIKHKSKSNGFYVGLNARF